MLKAHRGDPAAEATLAAFPVGGTPTYLILDASGEPISGWVGFQSTESWLAYFADAEADPLPRSARHRRLAENPNVGDALALGRTAHNTGDYGAAHGYFQQALSIDESAARAEQVSFQDYKSVCYGIDKGVFGMDDAGTAIVVLLDDSALSHRNLFRVAGDLFRYVASAGEEAIFPLLTLARGRVADVSDPDYIQHRQEFMVEYAARVDKDIEGALAMKRDFLLSNGADDPAALNGFAWWCFEHEINLQEAEAKVRRAVELSDPGPGMANILDTQAMLVHRRGDTRAAGQIIERAIAMDPGNEYLLRQREKIQSEGEN